MVSQLCISMPVSTNISTLLLQDGEHWIPLAVRLSDLHCALQDIGQNLERYVASRATTASYLTHTLSGVIPLVVHRTETAR